MAKTRIPITDTEHEAIEWSEMFPNYNREKSYIVCECAGTIHHKGKDRFDGTFVVHIYRKGDFHFRCGVDYDGGYYTSVRRED